jgi:hypothetical protein
MQTITDFREYRRGRRPFDFTPLWAGTATLWVDGAEFDPGSKNRLSMVNPISGAGTLSAWAWAPAYTPGGGAPGSLEVLVTFRAMNTLASSLVAIAASGASGSESCYLLKVTATGATATLAVVRRVAGVETTVCSGTVAIAAGSWYIAVVTLTSPKTFAIKTWELLATEPGSPLATGTDAGATLPDGYVAVCAAEGAGSAVDFGCWSVGTGGQSALRPSALPRGMEVWSRDPSASIEWTVEIDGYLAADNRSATFWFSSIGRHTAANEFPASLNLLPYVTDAGSIASSILGDIQFQAATPAILGRGGLVPMPAGSDVQAAASAASSSSNPLTGDALEQVGALVLGNARGRLSYLTDWSFAGRTLCVRGGERGSSSHRAFEPIYTALIADEPDIEDVITFPLAAKLAALSQNLARNTFLGIPTCITNAGGTSFAGAGSSAAQNLSTFTALIRFRCHGLLAAAGGYVYGKTAGAGSTQFLFGILPSTSATPGQLQVQVSPGLSFTIPGRIDDGAWHVAILSIAAGISGFVMLDGVIQGPYGIAVTPSTAGNVVLDFDQNADVLDARLYSFPMSPSEALAASSQVEDVSRPGLVGYWRCDDFTGTTVTDYSPTANNAAFTDVGGQPAMAFAPSDLGDTALAGNPMPIAVGTVYNAPAVRHDAERERWMLNDGAIPGLVSALLLNAGLNAQVKSQGFILAPGSGSPLPVTSAVVGATDSGGPGFQLVTVTMATAPGWRSFGQVTMAGATPSALNGTQVINSILSATVFTFLVLDGVAVGAATGTITALQVADWTDQGNGCLQMAGGDPQPGTFDLVTAGNVGSLSSLSTQILTVVQALLAARGQPAMVAPAQVDGNAFEAVRRDIPFDGGLYYDQQVTADQMLQDALGGSLAHFRQDRSGRLIPSVLYPPVTPGPYGLEPALEFLGLDNAGVMWRESAIGGGSAASTILGGFNTTLLWFKVHAVQPDPTLALVSTLFPFGQTLIDTLDSGIDAGFWLGLSAKTGQLTYFTPGVVGAQWVQAPAGYIKPEIWYLLAITLGVPHSGVSARTIFCAPTGAAAAQPFFAVTGITMGSYSATSGAARFGYGIGGNRGLSGSMCYAAAFAGGLNQNQISAYLTTKPTAADPNCVWFSPMTEGYRQTVCTETISGRQGLIMGARWCPRRTFDLRVRPIPTLSGVKNLKPTWHAELGWGKNYKPMTSADILGSVPAAQEFALKQPTSRVQVFDITTKTAFQAPREIILQTPMARAATTQQLMQMLLGRLAQGRKVAQLNGALLDGLPLQITDEVWVFSSQYHHQAGRAYRVVAPSAALSSRRIDLGLWGGSTAETYNLIVDSSTGDVLVVDSGTGDLLNVQ